MNPWAVLAATHATLTSGVGFSMIPRLGTDSLDGVAVGALLAGAYVVATNSPRRDLRGLRLPSRVSRSWAARPRTGHGTAGGWQPTGQQPVGEAASGTPYSYPVSNVLTRPSFVDLPASVLAGEYQAGPCSWREPGAPESARLEPQDVAGVAAAARLGALASLPARDELSSPYPAPVRVPLSLPALPVIAGQRPVYVLPEPGGDERVRPSGQELAGRGNRSAFAGLADAQDSSFNPARRLLPAWPARQPGLGYSELADDPRLCARAASVNWPLTVPPSMEAGDRRGAGRLSRLKRRIDTMLIEMLGDEQPDADQPGAGQEPLYEPDESFWGPSARADGSAAGYRSKHRLTDQAKEAKSPDGSRGLPRHAAPPASFSARLAGRYAAHTAG